MKTIKINVIVEERNGKLGIITRKEGNLTKLEEIAIFELLKKESIDKINKKSIGG